MLSKDWTRRVQRLQKRSGQTHHALKQKPDKNSFCLEQRVPSDMSRYVLTEVLISDVTEAHK